MTASAADRATANLPSRDLAATARFYAALGFEERFHDATWLILARGPLEIEFFPLPEIDPRSSIAGCCIRVSDVDVLYEAFVSAGLPGAGIPRLTPPANQPWGLREFDLVDSDGNLLRCLGPLR